MNPILSPTRLWLYAGLAFMTPIASNWDAMATATPHQWGGLLIQATITAGLAIRAYIDNTEKRP